MNEHDASKISQALGDLYAWDKGKLPSYLSEKERKEIFIKSREVLSPYKKARIADCHGNIFPCVLIEEREYQDEDGDWQAISTAITQFGSYPCRHNNDDIWYFDGELETNKPQHIPEPSE